MQQESVRSVKKTKMIVNVKKISRNRGPDHQLGFLPAKRRSKKIVTKIVKEAAHQC